MFDLVVAALVGAMSVVPHPTRDAGRRRRPDIKVFEKELALSLSTTLTDRATTRVWGCGWSGEGCVVEAPMVRKQVLGIEDELAVAHMARTTFNDEGMEALGWRHVRDVGELTEADGEEGLAGLHVKGVLASLLRPCRVF